MLVLPNFLWRPHCPDIQTQMRRTLPMQGDDSAMHVLRLFH